MNPPTPPPRIAVACGGTGGHLFPGLAVAEELADRGAEVVLLVSPKEVDRRALRQESRHRVVTLPAIGFSLRSGLRFLVQSWRSWRLARREFREAPPAVLLSLGGFTSAPPAVAARSLGAAIVLHEANAVPGRANRWLAPRAHRAYVYFPEAARRLRVRDRRPAGMPVRASFQPGDALGARGALGLAADRPVLLITGGSQGARGVNDALVAAIPNLLQAVPGCQFLHLTGAQDEARVRTAYAQAGVRAVVRAYLTEMELALAAADAVAARAGASSLAEFAAMGVPPLLIPYPAAADQHQMANARAVERTGGARVLAQAEATPERLAEVLAPLLTDPSVREALRAGLVPWHQPDAARSLAEDLLELAQARLATASKASSQGSLSGPAQLPVT